MTTSNWAGNYTYQASNVHVPKTVEEVQALVSAHHKVKALGTRHSFSDIADSPGGHLVSLEQLEPAIAVHAEAMTASVSAGTSYGVLASQLEAQGWALANLGSLPHISVGGATATATHGSGDGNGILSTSVAGVEVVRADGELVLVDRTSPDLEAMAVGLGAFGVITRVHLDVQPSYRVRQDVYRDASWDLVIESLDDVMASAYSVSLLGDIAGPVINSLWLKQRVDSGHGSAPATMYGGAWLDDADLPAGHSLTERAGVVGPWSERMAHFRLDAPPSAGGDELQSEYFVARDHGPAALRELRSMSEGISPHLHGMEVRTVAADSVWMSPAFQRPSLSIGFTWKQHPRAVLALLPHIERALAPFEPRPHWGKLFAMGRLTDRFPRLVDFVELAHEYDPDRKFWNPFLNRIAGAG